MIAKFIYFECLLGIDLPSPNRIAHLYSYVERKSSLKRSAHRLVIPRTITPPRNFPNVSSVFMYVGWM